MSFDIYGNHLRRRHCEVHPEVPEEYPCFVCRYKDKLKTYSESQPPEPTSEDYLVADAIAARDKEWVEKEKNLVSFISLIIKREGCIDALECEHNEGCVENVLHGKCNKAQELKKEVSNGK